LVKSSVKRAKAAAEYQAEAEDESTISIAVGDILRVINDSDLEWWEGQIEGTGVMGYFPASYVDLIEDEEGAAGQMERTLTGYDARAKQEEAAAASKQKREEKKAEKAKAKAKQQQSKKLEYKPPPPKLEPWEDPNSPEYDQLRVQTNAAFKAKEGGNTAMSSKKKKQLAAIEKKQAEAKAAKAALSEFNAEEQAQLEKLEANEKSLFAEYQKAFDEGSGMTKAQISAAGSAHRAAQAETKKYRETAIAAVRQRNGSPGSPGLRKTTTTMRKRAGDGRTPIATSLEEEEEPGLTTSAGGGAKKDSPPAARRGGGTGAAAAGSSASRPQAGRKKTDVKGYLAERGLSDWYRSLTIHGSVARVSQLENITER